MQFIPRSVKVFDARVYSAMGWPGLSQLAVDIQPAATRDSQPAGLTPQGLCLCLYHYPLPPPLCLPPPTRQNSSILFHLIAHWRWRVDVLQLDKCNSDACVPAAQDITERVSTGIIPRAYGGEITVRFGRPVSALPQFWYNHCRRRHTSLGTDRPPRFPSRRPAVRWPIRLCVWNEF
jgi:hypothetical protein